VPGSDLRTSRFQQPHGGCPKKIGLGGDNTPGELHESVHDKREAKKGHPSAK